MQAERRTMVGKVVSDKMDQTVVVAVETLKRHAMYGKTMRTVKNYKVHNADNNSHSGDTVRISECKPISKEKRWVVVEILERAE
jgi:small subunit ribosomal protein S17